VISAIFVRNFVSLKHTIMAYAALDIAHKIIKVSSDNDAGDLISNLKLQKLLYYHQGFHLSYFGDPLFDENIEAWPYGPVVPVVYDTYKLAGRGILTYEGDVIQMQEQEEGLFREVMRVYGEFSAIGLMNMTHQERPWKEALQDPCHVIKIETMKTFFKRRLK
jgi:uncharacterized phage-associated protein